MAQHDYIIANQSGAAFRADLNNGLAAIVSQNSGTAQPSTTYAYQWWADTTTGLLKLRNAANNAWITIGTLADANLGLLSLGGGTMTGALLADDSGTAALPAISFDGDSDTGIFRAGANELAVATNGTQRITIDSSGRLLVGTSSTAIACRQVLEGSSSTQAGVQILAANTSSPANGSALGAIYFADNTHASGLGICAEIFCRRDGGTWSASSKPTRLMFSTTADGASSSTERMRIDSTGYIRAVGTSSTARIIPNTDNVGYLGQSSERWQAVYAVNGTIQTSDRRQKTDITEALLGSDFVKTLKPVSYKWIEGGKEPTGEIDENEDRVFTSIPGQRTHWGFIAQDVKEAVDAAGVDFGGWLLDDKDDPDSQQALRYDQFIAPLTKALQEALAEIDVLKAKVAALEAS